MVRCDINDGLEMPLCMECVCGTFRSIVGRLRRIARIDNYRNQYQRRTMVLACVRRRVCVR